VGSESGRSGFRRRVGSTSCGSFIGRECCESWVDLLSSHVTSSFHSDVPKYRGPPSPMETVFGVPDRTLSEKKIKKIKKPKIQKSKILWSIVVQSSNPSVVLREPHFLLFCLLFLSIPEVQPFVGGHPFCVVLFSIVVRCPFP